MQIQVFSGLAIMKDLLRTLNFNLPALMFLALSTATDCKHQPCVHKAVIQGQYNVLEVILETFYFMEIKHPHYTTFDVYNKLLFILNNYHVS